MMFVLKTMTKTMAKILLVSYLVVYREVAKVRNNFSPLDKGLTEEYYSICEKYYFILLREDTHKKSVFTVVGPLSKKPLFFYKWRKFIGKLHNENIILTPAP